MIILCILQGNGVMNTQKKMAKRQEKIKRKKVLNFQSTSIKAYIKGK